MYRKHFFKLLATAALLVVGSIPALAQTGAVRGKVMIKQADGTTVPAENAVIDVYRLDIPSKQENIKVSKKGDYHIIGLFVVGKYVLSVSAPGAFPKLRTNVKPGQDADVDIVLDPGDGRRYTQEEAKKLAEGGSDGGGGGGGESAEDRAKREELLRKNAEIMEQNRKVEEANAIITRTFKAGREAMRAGKWDEAIAQYNEGLAAEPNQYTLLSDKANALKERGFQTYQAANKADEAAKKSLQDAYRKDLKEAYESVKKSYELFKAEPVPAEQAAQANHTANKLAILDIRAEVFRLHALLVDQTKSDEAYAASEDYLAAETKSEYKAKRRLDAANMLHFTGNWEKASTEFKKILESDPDNVEALRGAGMALFGAPDESTYQEAANYLQRFVEKAPDTHPDKADARAILEELKKKDIKPQKNTGGRRRG